MQEHSDEKQVDYIEMEFFILLTSRILIFYLFVS